ncbi:MAG: hypothetical protein GXP55_24545 [Deltaproteobacteria bacterium]|nr:hypothetical protein [Deltaproteobacteria bacterium]
MRTSAFFVLFALTLAGCSAVYPADDFSYTECGPALQHWTGGKPCTNDILTCLAACTDNTDCERACYNGRPVCANCLITESVLCWRELGCEPEYEDFACCAADQSCRLDDDTCLNAQCSVELESWTACQSELVDDCVPPVIDVCVR